MVALTILYYVLLAIWPVSAQNNAQPFHGTTLSFLESDEIASCPDAASLPSFHTDFYISNTAAFCIDVEDLFTHPNRTNVTVGSTDIPYELTRPDAWSSSGNFSGLRYTNGYADLNDDDGPATYWITFYDGDRCIQQGGDWIAPWMSFSCAETEGQCFQLPFNIRSFSLKREDTDPGKHCDLNAAEGAGNRLEFKYGMLAVLSGTVAFLLLI